MKWRWWKTGENFYYHFVLRENINFHCSDLLYSRWLQPLSNIHVIIRLSERNTSAIVFMKSTLLEFSMILEGKLDREGTLAGTKWYCENYDYWSKENFIDLKKCLWKIFSTFCPNIQQTDKFHNLFKFYCKEECISFQYSLKYTNANPCYNEQFMLYH